MVFYRGAKNRESSSGVPRLLIWTCCFCGGVLARMMSVLAPGAVLGLERKWRSYREPGAWECLAALSFFLARCPGLPSTLEPVHHSTAINEASSSRAMPLRPHVSLPASTACSAIANLHTLPNAPKRCRHYRMWYALYK